MAFWNDASETFCARSLLKSLSLRTLLRPQRRTGNFCARKERQCIALYVFASKPCLGVSRPPGACFCVMAIGSVFCGFTCNHALRCEKKLRIPSSRGRLLLYVSNPPPHERVCGGNFPALEMRSCT
jgi:hypothetical protein